VVVVPPDLAPDFDDDFDELPQALSATTAISAARIASAERVRLLKTSPPPRGLLSPQRIPTRRAMANYAEPA
jgi:hypothetical protein